MVRQSINALLCASLTVIILPVQAAVPDFPGQLILGQIASVAPGNYTADLFQEGDFWVNNIQVLSTASDCIVHRQEDATHPIRNALSCSHTFKEWKQDENSVMQMTTSEVSDEQLSIGMTDYLRFGGLNGQTVQPSSAYFQDSQALVPFIGQWLRFDGTTTKQENIFASNLSKAGFENKLRMLAQAAEPFGWQQQDENTWTTPSVFLIDRWGPMGMLVNLQALTFGDGMIKQLETIFMTGPSNYTGTYVVRGEQSGDISVEGTKEQYSKLTMTLTYDPGRVAMTWTAMPINKTGDTPFFRQTATYSGLDMELTQETDYGEDFMMKVRIRRTVSNKRPLEADVVAPATSLHGGEALAPQAYSCAVVQYTDLCNHWSLKWMLRAMANNNIGYIGSSQYGDNPPKQLRPDHPIQRSEFAHLIVTSHSLQTMLNYYHMGDPSWDTDAYVPSDADAGAWYMESVKWVVQTGVAVLQDGKRFRPNDTLNRAEVMTFLARIIDKSVQQERLLQRHFASWREKNPGARTVYFADVSVDSWYAPYVLFMAEAGIVDSKQPRFRPGDAVTRAEAITLLERLREKMPNFLTGLVN